MALIARGAHYAAIRDHGLRIQSPVDDALLTIPVVDHPSQLSLTTDDVMILAMKSQDTIGACERSLPARRPTSRSRASRTVSRTSGSCSGTSPTTYAVCVMSPTAHIEPGVVMAQSAPVSGLLDIGCYPNGLDSRAEAIAGRARTHRPSTPFRVPT